MPTTKFAAQAGDGGTLRSRNATYSTANAGSNLSLATLTAITGQSYSGTEHNIREHFFAIDISVIPSGSTIDSAVIDVNVTSNTPIAPETEFVLEAFEFDYGTLAADAASWQTGTELLALTRLATLTIPTTITAGEKAMTSDSALVTRLQAALDAAADFHVVLASRETKNSSAGSTNSSLEDENIHLDDNEGSASIRPAIEVVYSLPSDAGSFFLGTAF